jgi:hypothetical protein
MTVFFFGAWLSFERIKPWWCNLYKYSTTWEVHMYTDAACLLSFWICHSTAKMRCQHKSLALSSLKHAHTGERERDKNLVYVQWKYASMFNLFCTSVLCSIHYRAVNIYYAQVLITMLLARSCMHGLLALLELSLVLPSQWILFVQWFGLHVAKLIFICSYVLWNE